MMIEFFKSKTVKIQMMMFSGLVIGLQVAVALIGYYSMSQIEGHLFRVFKERLPSIDYLVQADRDFQQALVAERSLLVEGLAPDERRQLAEDYFANKSQVRERFESYAALASTQEEKKSIRGFWERFEEWEGASNKQLGLNADGFFRSGASIYELRRASAGVVSEKFEAAREHLDHLQELTLKRGSEEYASAESTYQNSTRTLVLVGLLGTVLAVLLSFFIVRLINGKVLQVVSRLDKGSQKLSTVSDDLATRSSDLVSAAHEQATSVTQTSSSLHQITQVVEQNSHNAQSSSSHVRESDQMIQESLRALQDLAASIDDINESSKELVQKVSSNNRDMEKIIAAFKEIESKTGVINDIVTQTKLLSFNASVEAARAGEYGKGFAVVAEEVGKLAQVSGQSAAEISRLLESSSTFVVQVVEKSKSDMANSVERSQERIGQSMEASERCRRVLDGVSQKFGLVMESSESIAQASKEQSQGVSEINKAIQEINESNQVTSSSAHQLDQVASDLIQEVTEVRSSLELLRQLVESSANQSVSPAQLPRSNTGGSTKTPRFFKAS